MRYLVFAPLFFITIASQQQKTVKFIVLFDQLAKGRPLATSKDAFWRDRAGFDTLVISNQGSVKNINEKLGLLNRTDMEFSVYAVFIKYYNIGPPDTFYTDRFFENWEMRGTLMEDKSGYFKKTFAGLFPY